MRRPPLLLPATLLATLLSPLAHADRIADEASR